MCHDARSSPPLHPGGSKTVTGEPVTLTSADGTRFAAFLAVPEPTGQARLGVVVLPDNRGLAPFYQQLVCRLAGQGYPAIAFDYFGRTAGADDRDRGDEFPVMHHLTRLTRTGVQDDLAAAAGYLRQHERARATRSVALGFCFGGRYAYLASAPRFGFDGVIGFHGLPGAAGPYGPGPTQHAAELGAPILALFGGADEGIPAGEVQAFDESLAAAGVTHDIVVYPGAPHGFFDVHQPAFAATSADAWQRVLGFLGERSRG